MKILLVTDAYPPEIGSASHLMHALAEELRDRNHEVTVATCFPRYNLANGPMAKNFEELTLENGIQVIRIRTLPHHKVNFIIRGISQVMLPYIFCSKLRRYLKGGLDTVIVYSPPLPLWKVGFRVKKLYNARFILNIQDIFPQNAIDLGALNNRLLIWLFEKMEQAAYCHADFVTVHSRGNRELLIRDKGLSPQKLLTINNWVSLETSEKPMKLLNFRNKLSLENKFIFFFGGVMGPSQGLDLIIDAAKILKDEKDIVVLLVGDGMEKKKLQELSNCYALKNVFFSPFISKEDYRVLLTEIDVGLVCLTTKNKTPPVPGKILDYMVAAVPVLALLNKESDAHYIISESGCGYSVISDDAHKAANLMLKMYQERNRLKDMGTNGYQYAMNHFSKTVCVDQLEKLM